MKRLLLLVLVFVSLTGFSSKEMKEVSVKPTPVNILLQSQSLPPQIIGAVPESREILVKAGDRIDFSIAYKSDSGAKVTLERQNGTPIESNTFHSDGHVTIIGARLANIGGYILTVSNEAGSTSILFRVLVASDF